MKQEAEDFPAAKVVLFEDIYLIHYTEEISPTCMFFFTCAFLTPCPLPGVNVNTGLHTFCIMGNSLKAHHTVVTISELASMKFPIILKAAASLNVSDSELLADELVKTLPTFFTCLHGNRCLSHQKFKWLLVPWLSV